MTFKEIKTKFIYINDQVILNNDHCVITTEFSFFIDEYNRSGEITDHQAYNIAFSSNDIKKAKKDLISKIDFEKSDIYYK
jgi:hypothetical protein